MKKIILFLILTGLITILLSIHALFNRTNDLINAQVLEVYNGNILILTNGQKIQMAGIAIPTSGPNHFPNLIANMKNLFENQNIKYKIIQMPKHDYPPYPLCLIYIDSSNNKSVNEQILERGEAFFDNSYYRDRQHFMDLENKARTSKNGIWKNMDELTLLYVGSKKWKFIHKPDCPEVNKIRKEDRIEYYVVPPEIFLYHAPLPCPHSNGLEKIRGKGKNE